MIQELSTHIGDNVRLGRGFVFFHVTLELTQVGLMHVPTIMQAVYTVRTSSEQLSLMGMCLCTIKEDDARVYLPCTGKPVCGRALLSTC